MQLTLTPERKLAREDVDRVMENLRSQGRITSYNVCYTKLLRSGGTN